MLKSWKNMFCLRKWHFLSIKHSKNNPNGSKFKDSHICLLPSLHFRKPILLISLAWWLVSPENSCLSFFGCIYNTWKYSNEPRRFLGNLCFPSTTDSSQASPRMTPPQPKCSHYLPTASGMQFPISCFALALIPSFASCSVRCHCPREQLIKVLYFKLQSCPKNCCKHSLCLKSPFLGSENIQY